MFCMNCGHELPDGAKFCSNCGTPLGQAAPAAASNEPACCEVIINRKKQTLSSAVAVGIYVDGLHAGMLFNGGSLAFDVPLGIHQIVADGGTGLGMKANYTGEFQQDAVLEFASKMSGFSLKRVR